MDGKKSVTEILEEVADDICNNFCKYREKINEDGKCEYVVKNGTCPLWKL